MQSASRPGAKTRERIHPLLIWLTPFALFAPYAIAFYVGDLKFTPGKLLITVLIVPAIGELLSGVAAGRRRLLAADALAGMIAVWMVAAPIAVAGASVTTGAASQALEFFGSYVIGRTFLAGPRSLAMFSRSLRVVLLLVVAFGLLDTITHRFVVYDTLVGIFHPSGGALDSSEPNFHRTVAGFDLLRATSTFDHPILYGSFCAIAATILLYPPGRLTARWPILLISLVGCLLSLSSASLLAMSVAVTVFCYDRATRWSGKWKLLLLTILAGLVALAVLSDSPETWIIRHLTLDPQTGYFRLLMWYATGDYLSEHAIAGSGLLSTGNWLLDGSVDSVWLGKALNYGLPMVGGLLAIIGSALTPSPREAAIRRSQPDLDSLCTTYSLVLVLFCLIGLTVYFWNAMWLFWSLCMGIRVALKEYCMLEAAPRPAALRTASWRPRAPAGVSP